MRWAPKLASMALATAVVVTAVPSAHASTKDAPSATVEGVVEKLADEHGATDAHVDDATSGVALRLRSGQRVRVSPDRVAAARPGDTVAATLPVPAAVVAAARDGRTVAGDEGPVELDRRDLAKASSAPSAPESDLSAATAQAVSSTGQVTTPTGVRVVEHAARASSKAVHDVTVALAVPRGLKAAPATAPQVRAQVTAASAYWSEQTAGAVTLRASRVSAPYTSRYTCRDDVFAMWTEAARATGFVEGPNKHLVVVMPRSATSVGCHYGLATMGATVNSGGVLYVSDTAWPVLAHEIGHNFGLAHAKSLRCSAASDVGLGRLSSACRLVDYGDPYDIMAASTRDSAGSLSTPQSARVGFLGSTDVVQVGSGTRRVSLAPVSSLRGVRAAVVTDPLTKQRYWVEYRTRTGRDAKLYQNMPAGVRVLREEASSASQPWSSSIVLDASPSTSTKDYTWQLDAGRRFTSYGGGVTIEVERVGSTATVLLTSRGTVARASGTMRPGHVTPARPVEPTMSWLRATSAGKISWSGVVSPGTPRYRVIYRTVTKDRRARTQMTAARTWFTATTATSATFRGQRGVTYQVAVRAVGQDGKVGRSTSWRQFTLR